MRKKISIIFLFIFIILFLLCIALKSTPSTNNKYSSCDYVIDKYDINIIVNENNTFDITETITAYFNNPKHGILRTIPLKNTIKRLDNTTSNNRAKVSNLTVNNQYTTSRENGNLKIKIGSANRTLTGEQTYIIKYTYNIGKDPVKSCDELYFNIIGNNWDTVIGNITFSITMPKEFDSKKLGFSAGTKGSTNNSNIEYSISGNKITGNYNGILGVGEALTVRCELPNDYFVNAGLDKNLIDYLMFIVPITFLVIAILLWYRFGRDDKIVETVEFYPPEGLNSLDVGFFYKGYANNKDVSSLLIFLANKGYIEIIDKEVSLSSKEINLNNSSKNKFIIKKLKDYDGPNANERTFMEGLFDYNRTEVTDEMIYHSFFMTNNTILYNVNNKKNTSKVFEKSASNKRIFMILMIIATYCLFTIPPLVTYGQPVLLVITLLFLGTALLVLFNTIINKIYTTKNIFAIILTLAFFVLPPLLILSAILRQDTTYLIAYIIGMISIIGTVLCLVYLPKRTNYGIEMLGKLKGFKNFLETVEKDKLESFVMQNPNYFYDILPFTYVLGISNKWIKKFELISLQSPSWYDSYSVFNISNFGIFIDNTMTFAQDSITSANYGTRSSSSSSFDGGSDGGSFDGGSSGGGSGGGGGSSW